jgi:hypothetical protein
MEMRCMAVWTGLNWLGIMSVVGFCEHGNEFPVSIKVGHISSS